MCCPVTAVRRTEETHKKVSSKTTGPRPEFELIYQMRVIFRTELCKPRSKRWPSQSQIFTRGKVQTKTKVCMEVLKIKYINQHENELRKILESSPELDI